MGFLHSAALSGVTDGQARFAGQSGLFMRGKIELSSMPLLSLVQNACPHFIMRTFMMRFLMSKSVLCSKLIGGWCPHVRAVLLPLANLNSTLSAFAH